MSALFSSSAMVVPFEKLRMTDLEVVGGKNASLGEMISQIPTGVKVPNGFATTSHAFRIFLQKNSLDARIESALKDLDSDNISQLSSTGAMIRQWIIEQSLPELLEKEIRLAFQALNENDSSNSLTYIFHFIYFLLGLFGFGYFNRFFGKENIGAKRYPWRYSILSIAFVAAVILSIYTNGEYSLDIFGSYWCFIAVVYGIVSCLHI